MMRQVPYASAVGSLMYAMLCTRPDIYYLVGMVSRYQSNPGPKHWQAVKHILKYLRRTRDYMLVYRSEDLIPIGYTDSDFQSDLDFRKSISGCVLTLRGGAISWQSIKQSCIADSTMEAEYVAACEVAKEAVWLKKFLSDLGVMTMEQLKQPNCAGTADTTDNFFGTKLGVYMYQCTGQYDIYQSSQPVRYSIDFPDSDYNYN
ncbi:secreted RxLR effector protein 161-like [Quercus suber]|uniref:secreted RxLR effector protein 161-like n=1 Tax=Quercus suber TaxID=58331 RepID=UPI0032DF5C7A